MNWDKYFYEMCKAVAKNSKCLSRQIGSVLVRDKLIVSTGYNGPPRGLPHCGVRHLFDEKMRNDLMRTEVFKEDKYKYFEYVSSVRGKSYLKLKVCPRRVFGFKSGEGLDYCVAGHAERSSLINAARNGISTKGTILYMSCGVPCVNCLVEIINAGVLEIVITKLDWYDMSSEYVLKNSSLKYRFFDCEVD